MQPLSQSERAADATSGERVLEEDSSRRTAVSGADHPKDLGRYFAPAAVGENKFDRRRRPTPAPGRLSSDVGVYLNNADQFLDAAEG